MKDLSLTVKVCASFLGFTLFFGSFHGFAASNDKSGDQSDKSKSNLCQLRLVSSTTNPTSSFKSSNESEQYLAFLADMKLYGLSFKNPSDPVEVKNAFAQISALNLQRMLVSLNNWIKHEGDTPRVSLKGGHGFVYWKNFESTQKGFGTPRLVTDKKLLATGDRQRAVSLWSKVNEGFHGVPLNMEFTAAKPEELVQRYLGNGRARVVLEENVELEWAYSLPFVGSEDADYVNLDIRFLAFLGVFSPELFGKFFLDHQYFFSEKVSLEDVIQGRVTNDLNAFLKYDGMKWMLKKWFPYFKHLILNKDDAQYLVAYLAGQKQHFNYLANIITVMIPGEIGAEDYMIQDQPYDPKPSLARGASSGGKIVRQGPKLDLLKPSMTGDTPPFSPNPPTD